MVIHLGALVDDPPHERAAVTHNWPVVNPDGKLTVTFVGLLPPLGVTAAAEPFNVHV